MEEFVEWTFEGGLNSGAAGNRTRYPSGMYDSA